MFKNISSRVWLFIAGGICAALAVLAIIAVAVWDMSVVFVFPPAVFAAALLASGASMGEGAAAPKTARKKQEEEYVSPFFADNDNNKKTGRKK